MLNSILPLIKANSFRKEQERFSCSPQRAGRRSRGPGTHRADFQLQDAAQHLPRHGAAGPGRRWRPPTRSRAAGRTPLSRQPPRFRLPLRMRTTPAGGARAPREPPSGRRTVDITPTMPRAFAPFPQCFLFFSFFLVNFGCVLEFPWHSGFGPLDSLRLSCLRVSAVMYYTKTVTLNCSSLQPHTGRGLSL